MEGSLVMGESTEVETTACTTSSLVWCWHARQQRNVEQRHTHRVYPHEGEVALRQAGCPRTSSMPKAVCLSRKP